MIDECRRHGIPAPEFAEITGATVVRFKVAVGSTAKRQATPQVTPQVIPQVTPQVVALVKAARRPMSRTELQEVIGLKDRMHFQRAYLDPLLVAGWLQMTIPDKPNSRLQRYRVTPAGAALSRD